MFSPRSTSLSSSFTCRRINKTTFLIREHDLYNEHPFIYAKLHPTAPILILSDTGCDEPSSEHKQDRFIHLRDWLEHCPAHDNNDAPLNRGGKRQYIIFLRSGSTEIIASAAGRDFVESDLETYGLFKHYGIPTPYYQVTRWAQAFEKLTYAPAGLSSNSRGRQDLGVTIIQTPGHTPDELAWFDHAEMCLFVGDSLYHEGEDGMPILWPSEGNMIEWVFSMQKLKSFVNSVNAKAMSFNADEGDEDVDDWVRVAKRVQICCAHQTALVDGEQILADVENFWWRTVRGEVPVVKSHCNMGEVYDLWRGETTAQRKLSFGAPRRLMIEARAFFSAESGL